MAEFISEYGVLLAEGLRDTLYMSLMSAFFSYVLGLPMGVLLFITEKGGIKENVQFNRVYSWLTSSTAKSAAG